MGFLKKLKFWKKRNNNTPTKVDACVSTEDPRTCDGATVTMDPTVMCAAYTQTDITLDGGVAAAVKDEYKRELEMKTQKIRELEEELAASKRLTADLLLNVNSVELQVRKYAEEPVTNWADDCECKQQMSAVADLLKKIINTERDTKKSKPEVTSGGNKKVHHETQTQENSSQRECAGRNSKVHRKTRTEANGRQRNCATADEKEAVRRLEEKNMKLSVLVDESEREIVRLNDKMEHLRDRTSSHIHHIKMRYEKLNYRQLLKMRDMRDELLWYKEQLPGIRMPTGLDGSVASHNVAVMSVDKNAAYYKMNHKRRGMAIIFNHEYFDIQSLGRRNGTNVDRDKLKHTMEDLGFQVAVYDNLTCKDIMKVLDQAAQSDHSDCDCFLVAVLSHGEMGIIYARDTAYKPESLWTPFTGDKCPSLAGKPKLFFLQACRGDKLDGGIRLEARTEVDGNDMGYTISIHADFLVAYSTIPGFYSWRNIANGSWFVQALCCELQDSGTTDDIFTLLTSVTRCVTLNFESNTPGNQRMHQQKQISCFTSSLIRKLHFTRK